MRKKRVLTDEHREKLRIAALGKKRKYSEKAIENIRSAAKRRIGKCFNPPMGEYQKQRIREANSKPKTEDHKRKISEKLKGKERPDLSQIAKKRYENGLCKLKPILKGNIPWNKGICNPSRSRNSKLSRIWAKKVKERDKWVCQKCGLDGCNTGKKMHAHHIIRWKDKPDLRYEIDNGMTLCLRCHAILEGFQKGHLRITKKEKTFSTSDNWTLA